MTVLLSTRHSVRCEDDDLVFPNRQRRTSSRHVFFFQIDALGAVRVFPRVSLTLAVIPVCLERHSRALWTVSDGRCWCLRPGPPTHGRRKSPCLPRPLREKRGRRRRNQHWALRRRVKAHLRIMIIDMGGTINLPEFLLAQGNENSKLPSGQKDR